MLNISFVRCLFSQRIPLTRPWIGMLGLALLSTCLPRFEGLRGWRASPASGWLPGCSVPPTAQWRAVRRAASQPQPAGRENLDLDCGP
jgi:hypothetical protein